MLTADEIHEVAENVFRKTLGDHGYQRSEVAFGDDHDGVPSIFLDVYFREGSEPTPGKATIDAISGVARALELQDELRFPYYRPKFVGDEIGVE